MAKIRSKAGIQRRKHVLKIYFWSAFLGLVLIIGSFLYYIYSPDYIIRETHIRGVTLSNESKIKEITQKYLNIKKLNIIPINNWLLFPIEEVRLSLQSDPTIKDAKVEVRAGDLYIEVVEREPSYVWCGENTDAIKSCYFVDDEGIVFAEAPIFQGSTYIKVFKHIEGEILGTKIEDKEFLSALSLTVAEVKPLSLDIRNVILGSSTHVTLEDRSGLKLYVDKNTSPQDILERLKAFMSSKEVFNSFSDFEYIDLRSEHKIFLKRKRP